MEKETIIKANDFISDEDIKEMEEAMNFIAQQRKLCLIKYFDYKDYNNKILERYPFSYTCFWAMARDCVVDMDNEKVYVLWRIEKKKEVLPRLMYIKQKKDSTLWTIRYPLGRGEHSKRNIWETKRIEISNEEMKKFEEDYKDEIEYLQNKTFPNQC